MRRQGLNLTRFRDPSRRTRHRGEPYGPHADGCERLPTVAVANATCGEHSLTPRPPSETGTLATHSGKRLGITTCVITESSKTVTIISKNSEQKTHHLFNDILKSSQQKPGPN